MKNTKRQTRIRKFKEINVFMEQNLEKWNSIDEIRRTYDVFVNNLKKINDLQPELKQEVKGLTEELEAKREVLLKKIFPIGNILEVYAQDHSVGKNSESLLIGQKRLEVLSNKDLLHYALNLHKRCDRFLQHSIGTEPLDRISPNNDIKRYGLTRYMLDDLYSVSQQFQSTLKLRKDVQTYRKRTRQKVDGLISTNRQLLANRLDKLMSVFSGTHPSFYGEYRRIRSKN
jgi:hypothetical protein